MSNIVPISELKSYTVALKKVTSNEPLILTKNGYGEYAVLSLDKYETMQNEIQSLKDELRKTNGLLRYYRETERSVIDKMNGKKMYSIDEVAKELGWDE